MSVSLTRFFNSFLLGGFPFSLFFFPFCLLIEGEGCERPLYTVKRGAYKDCDQKPCHWCTRVEATATRWRCGPGRTDPALRASWEAPTVSLELGVCRQGRPKARPEATSLWALVASPGGSEWGRGGQERDAGPKLASPDMLCDLGEVPCPSTHLSFPTYNEGMQPNSSTGTSCPLASLALSLMSFRPAAAFRITCTEPLRSPGPFAGGLQAPSHAILLQTPQGRC